MSKIKNILTIVLSTLLLIGIGTCIFFLLTNHSNTKEETYQLTEHKTIDVKIENKGVSSLDSLTFLGKKTDDLKDSFKNITYVDDSNIRMSNIIWNEIIGEMILSTKNGTVHSFSFMSNEYASVNDISIIFDTLNKKIAENNGLSPKNIMITDGNEIKEFEKPEELYASNKKLIVEYLISGTTIFIETEYNNNNYKIIVHM